MSKYRIDPITEDVLRLLVFVITADAKIYQEEVDSFLNVTADMSLVRDDGRELTREWLFDWFLQNYEYIKAEAERPNANSLIVHLFIRLQSWQDKQQLLGALRSVAASDGQYHINEKVLIALAAAYWDAKTPAMN